MELYEAVENLIIVSSHNSIVGNNISFSGLVSIIDYIFNTFLETFVRWYEFRCIRGLAVALRETCWLVFSKVSESYIGD